MTFQNNHVRFCVSLMVSGEGRRTTHLLKCVRLLSSSRTDWRQSSDILSDISFDSLSNIFSGISSGFWHIFWHSFWHSFWHISSHDRGWGPARNTELTGSRLRSGTEHWTHRIAVEVRHGPLNSQDRGWRRGGRGGEGGEGEEGGEAPDIKSNNPHLTGGEKNAKNLLITIWNLENNLFFCLAKNYLLDSKVPFFDDNPENERLEPKNHRTDKGKSSKPNLHDFDFQMLIFQGVQTFFDKTWRQSLHLQHPTSLTPARQNQTALGLSRR